MSQIAISLVNGKVTIDIDSGAYGHIVSRDTNVVYSSNSDFIFLCDNPSSGNDINSLKLKILDIIGRPSDIPKEVAEWLRDNFFFNGGLDMYVGEFATYTDLISSYPSLSAGRFAFVLNSEGTSWLPGSVGGSYYGAGWYYDTGTVWTNKNDAIFAGLDKATPRNSVVSSSTTLTYGSHNISITATGITVTLFLTPVDGDIINIINDSGGLVYLNGNSNLIYDSAIFDLFDGEGLHLVYNNSKWNVI